MKKILGVLISLCLSVPAYAGTLTEFEEYLSMPQYEEEVVENLVDELELSIEFSSGITRDRESTFDLTRVLIGATLEDTMVFIDQYIYDEETEKFKIIDNHEITVGFLGVFTQSFSLLEGKNFFHISAENGDLVFERYALISRKPMEVKAELERSIILPTKNLSMMNEIRSNS